MVRNGQAAEGFQITRIARSQPLKKSRGLFIASGSFRRAIGPIVESRQPAIATGRRSHEIEIDGVTGRGGIIYGARLYEPGSRTVGVLGADQTGEHPCPVRKTHSVLRLVSQVPNDPLRQLTGPLGRRQSGGAIACAPFQRGEPNLDRKACLPGTPIEIAVNTLRASEPQPIIPLRSGLVQSQSGRVILPLVEQEQALGGHAAGQARACLVIAGVGAKQFGVETLCLLVRRDRIPWGSRDLGQVRRNQSDAGEVSLQGGIAAKLP
jgi:hypothetical protein